MPFSRDELGSVLEQASAKFPDQDFYLRPTAYAKTGRSSASDGAEFGWYVGAFPISLPTSTEPLAALISWPSRSGSSVPPTAKTGGSYLDFRTVTRSKEQLGASVMLMVDPDGNLTEADGCGLIVIDDGEVIVPPTAGHALNSITRQVLVHLAEHRAMNIVSRPVHWSEAHGTPILLGGTLAGVRVATLRDSHIEPLANDVEIAQLLAEDYHALLRDEDEKDWLELIRVHELDTRV
jgi:branched-subunit amino acid aminotransferase/4-amino-4-deoxychorismate lyase